MKNWRIIDTTNGLYWSNELGWTSKSHADRYDYNMRVNNRLPIGGAWEVRKGTKMKTYTSGRSRVHTSSSVQQILAAIAEYDAFVRDQPDNPLSKPLKECATDLREELELRKLTQTK